MGGPQGKQFRNPCVKASNKANTTIGMINRAIKIKTQEAVVQLYKYLVRPHLDYSIQACRPFKQTDTNLLESAQRRATSMVSDLRHLGPNLRARLTSVYA